MTRDQVVLLLVLTWASAVCWITGVLYEARIVGPRLTALTVALCWCLFGWLALGGRL